jgi:hypothetical protein
VLQFIDTFTYCDMIDTNVMELVLDNRQLGGSFEHSQYLLQHAQAVGGIGMRLKEKTQERDEKQTDKQAHRGMINECNICLFMCLAHI